MFGKAQAKEYDRSLQILAHSHNSANGSTFSNERRFFAECVSHRIARCVGVPPAVRRAINQSFVRGFRHVMLCGALLALASGTISWWLIDGKKSEN